MHALIKIYWDRNRFLSLRIIWRKKLIPWCTLHTKIHFGPLKYECICCIYSFILHFFILNNSFLQSSYPAWLGNWDLAHEILLPNSLFPSIFANQKFRLDKLSPALPFVLTLLDVGLNQALLTYWWENSQKISNLRILLGWNSLRQSQVIKNLRHNARYFLFPEDISWMIHRIWYR